MDTTFSTLTNDFLTHGLYLRGWSARTVRTYRQGLATLPPTLTKSTLVTWVVGMRDRGLTPGGINMYARTFNSYLSWLHAEGHTSATVYGSNCCRIRPSRSARYLMQRFAGWWCFALTVASRWLPAGGAIDLPDSLTGLQFSRSGRVAHPGKPLGARILPGPTRD